ncbi:hypothetical protein NDU88_003167 [Pleurodeles waltl]|uniref:Uncharacterized protein n=1 Tax=Pleurodeles waltl TaxID=8319 RepID=A0AAV7MQF3_PLEWA|nr:hypothetical protein NDU88_003167 [Pleurodeles waltl]
MGTLTPSRPHFPGNREPLELVGTAGHHKDADRIEEVCVGGERRTEDGDTRGQQETTENGTKGRRKGEKEATNEGTPESRTQEAHKGEGPSLIAHGEHP